MFIGSGQSDGGANAPGDVAATTAAVDARAVDVQAVDARAADVQAVDVLAVLGQAQAAIGAVNGWVSAQGDAPDPTLVGPVLEGLGRVDAALTAARARTIAAAETVAAHERDGEVSPPAWVAARLRMTQAAARRECRLAADLVVDLPEVLTSLTAGEVSRDHATALAAALVQQRQDHEAAERARVEEEARLRRERELADARALQEAADATERQRRALEAARREEEIAAQQELARRQRAAEAARAEADRQAALLERAKGGGSADEVRERARRDRAADVEALRRAEAAQWSRRSVIDWIDPVTGMGMVKAALPVEEHERLLAAIDALHCFDKPEVPESERRSREQRRADAFIGLVRRALAAGDLPTVHGAKPHLTVYGTAETLAGTAEEPARTSRGNWLSPEAFRRISCDAGLTRAILDPAGQVLDLGRETRRWTVGQYRAAELRFGGCAFPVADGEPCGRPPEDCDLHHITWWRHGGRTDQVNGAPQCPRHHDAVHNGWTMTYDHTTQTVTVTRERPDGTTERRSVCFARDHDRLVLTGAGSGRQDMTGGSPARWQERLLV